MMVGGAVGLSQNRARKLGLLDPASQAIQSIVRPGINGVDAICDWTSELTRGIGRGPSLARENAILKSQVQGLQGYSDREERLERELEEAKSLLGIRGTIIRPKIAASITDFHPYEDRITLNVGSRNGVKPGLAVISGRGLLGVVQTVSAGTCQVTLIYSAALTVGAMINTDPPVAGLLRGESPSRLVFDTNDSNLEMPAGAKVMTNGFSETIPRGIVIGVVQGTENLPEFGRRQAKVVPLVNLATVGEVFVIQ